MRPASLLFSVLLVGCPDSRGPLDSGPPPRDASADSGSMDGGGQGGCGSAQPDVSSITGTEGLVIARDGTMYFSQSGGVGRMLPNGSIDASWLRISATSTVFGLTLDAANQTLFVGVPGVGIFTVDLAAATPDAVPLVDGGVPNGLTMGPDGMLYFSDFGADAVYRVAPSGGLPSEVTTSAIVEPNGLAFEAAGTLLVLSYASGEVFRLTLTDGRESARVTVGPPLAAPDGVALDDIGRIYITDQSRLEIVRMDADGSGFFPLPLTLFMPANLEFGHGALGCSDLYVATGNSLERYANDAPGASVPWH